MQSAHVYPQAATIFIRILQPTHLASNIGEFLVPLMEYQEWDSSLGTNLSISRGHIFSHVRLLCEWAVSNLNRSVHRSRWALVTHALLIEG